MYVKETLKKTVETVTGMGKPSFEEARDAVRRVTPETILFSDDGITPNNPRLPFICYPGAVELSPYQDPAAVFEDLFHRHDWNKSWRNGIYDYLHYHSRTHEVLGIARGAARVRFGGDKGRILEIRAGDVAILPAGTGHQCLAASSDLLVVGAYPPQGSYEECRGTAAEHARAARSIADVPVPASDPIYGKDAGLTEIWRRE
jgi:uncharacterized protein YjlB